MARDLVQIGRALSAPARVAMINVLFDGAEHPAGELARAAGVSPATASGHLTTLTEAGIVAGYSLGRYRYYRLADGDVSYALEQLSQGYPEPVITSLRLSREQQRVRTARTCYDHLAGQLGVGVTDRFIELGWIDAAVSTLSPLGVEEVRSRLGIDADLSPSARRPLVRACTDWTERRAHMAGRLGAAVATSFLDRRWVARKAGSRALLVTEEGRAALARLGIAPAAPRVTVGS